MHRIEPSGLKQIAAATVEHEPEMIVTKKIEQFNNPAFLSIFETNISHYVYKKRQWPLVSQEMNDTLHSLHTELI